MRRIEAPYTRGNRVCVRGGGGARRLYRAGGWKKTDENRPAWQFANLRGNTVNLYVI